MTINFCRYKMFHHQKSNNPTAKVNQRVLRMMDCITRPKASRNPFKKENRWLIVLQPPYFPDVITQEMPGSTMKSTRIAHPAKNTAQPAQATDINAVDITDQCL